MRFALKRLPLAVPVLLGVSGLTFLMLHLVPGDPVAAMFIGQGGAKAEQLEAVREQLGLNDPLPVQYVNYMKNVLQGDLGRSIRTNEPVSLMIQRNFLPTLQLTLASMALAIVIGVSFGVVAAVKRGRIVDNLVMLLALAGVSMPSFWLGCSSSRSSPSGSTGFRSLAAAGGAVWPCRRWRSDSPRRRSLPAWCAPASSKSWARTTSSQRAKGLAEQRVILRHALRNAAIPVITIVGLQFGGLLAGAVIVEQVFSRQGIGRMLVSALQSRDFPVAQGGVLFVATVYVFVNLLVDLLYGAIDPRISIDR